MRGIPHRSPANSETGAAIALISCVCSVHGGLPWVKDEPAQDPRLTLGLYNRIEWALVQIAKVAPVHL